MGIPVAARLQSMGYEVIGFRRSWPPEDSDVMRASSPSALADTAEVIFSCLPSDAALLEVIGGADGIIHGAVAGRVVVDLSMTSLEAKVEARELLRSAGAEMLDAPISGTPIVAAAGKASLFVSGEASAYEKVRPALDFAASAPLVGAFGTGSKLKYIANLLIGIHIAAAAEAVALAEHSGVDPQLLIETISGSVAASEMFRHRAAKMADRDFDAPMNDVNAFLKDVELIKGFARSSGAHAPLFQRASELYQSAAIQGLGDKELSAIVTLLTASEGVMSTSAPARET
jgi:3-hydroxyisobutyrate dehydrogenase